MICNLITNIELYRIFYVVSVVGNITKASEELFIGQPTISKAIKSIENTLNTTLFIRTPKGVSLTNEGKILFEFVSKGIIQMEQGEYLLLNKQSSDSINGEVNIIHYKQFILPHLKNYIDTHPNIKINILPITDSYASLTSLNEDKINFGIFSKPLNNNDIDFIPLYTLHDVLIGSRQYIKSLNLHSESSLCKATFISLGLGPIVGDYQKKYLKEINFKNEILTSSMDYTVELVKQNLGVGFIAKEIIKDELKSGQLIQLDFGFASWTRQVGFVLKKNKYIDKNLKEFISYYKNKLK